MAMISKLDKWFEQKIAGCLNFFKASKPVTFTLHPVKTHTDFAQIFLATQNENSEENKTTTAARTAENIVLINISMTFM